MVAIGALVAKRGVRKITTCGIHTIDSHAYFFTIAFLIWALQKVIFLEPTNRDCSFDIRLPNDSEIWIADIWKSNEVIQQITIKFEYLHTSSFQPPP